MDYKRRNRAMSHRMAFFFYGSQIQNVSDNEDEAKVPTSK